MKIELELQSDIHSTGNRYSIVCPACGSKKGDMTLNGALEIIEHGVHILRGGPKHEDASCIEDTVYAAGYDYCRACHSKTKR